MARVELENIVSMYGSDIRLRVPQLAIKAGERIAAVGPSGSGKSTLLRTLAGLNPPVVTGHLSFDGRNVSRTPSSQRQVGFVFQDFALYPHLSVLDNLALSLRFARDRRTSGSSDARDNPSTNQSIDARVLQVAKNFEIDDLLARRPPQLSGGQQQRVAIARAMIRGAGLQLLLMDEPLSDLDGHLRLRTRNHILDEQEKFAITMVHVTHDREEAMAVGQRLLVLRDGTIEQIGTPPMLYRTPANLFVASFLGEFTLNTYEGILRDGRLQFAGLTTNTPHLAKLGVMSELRVGLRPELMVTRPFKEQTSPDGTKIVVVGQRIESLGSRAVVHGRLPTGAEIRFTVESRFIDNGDRSFEIDLEHSPVFVFTSSGLFLG